MIARTLIKKTLQRYWRISRGLTLEARGVLRDAAGHVLLVRDGPKAPWRLPGGPVRAGETAEAAMERALGDDAGTKAPRPFRLLAIYARHGTRTTAQIVVFVVPSWTLLNISSGGEPSCLVNLFPPDKLPDDTEPATRKRIDDVISGRQAPELW